MINIQAPSLKTILSKTTGKNTRLRKLSGRYREDDRGIAAIEFAIIAPVMIGMYFGLAEIASAISMDRRISHSTNVVGDLSTQQPELRDGEIAEVLSRHGRFRCQQRFNRHGKLHQTNSKWSP